MILPERIADFKTIYLLGPKGTFSDCVALQINKTYKKHIVYTLSLADVLEKTEQDRHSIGVVPVENSSAGSVGIVWKKLLDSKLVIEKEIVLPIQYSLLAENKLSQANYLYCQPIAYEQIREFVIKHMPSVMPEFCRSNMEAATQFMSMPKEHAALVPWHLAQQEKIYQPFVRAEYIQDSQHNKTRFCVVSYKTEKYHFDFNREKTSIFVIFEEDHPSLLFHLLEVFHIYKINLCRIHSVTSSIKLWKYNFFIDFYNTKSTQACLEAIKEKNINFHILGCYNAHK